MYTLNSLGFDKNFVQWVLQVLQQKSKAQAKSAKVIRKWDLHLKLQIDALTTYGEQEAETLVCILKKKTVTQNTNEKKLQ